MKMIIFRENLHTLATLNAKKKFLPNIYLGIKKRKTNDLVDEVLK